MVESGLFGLFVTAIMCDQLQAIFGDETAVEQAKQQGPFRYLIFAFPLISFITRKIKLLCVFLYLISAGGFNTIFFFPFNVFFISYSNLSNRAN